MFFENRFTIRAEHVLRISHESAARLGHGYVGSEHILLGLISEEDGKASSLLGKFGITKEKCEQAIRENIGVGASGELTAQGLTPRARKIVKKAFSEAQKKNIGFISTEYLLLGILDDDESSAKKLLSMMDADVSRIKSELLFSMGQGGNDSDFDYKRDSHRQSSSRSETKLLANFGRDLTALARSGKLDPVIGREREIDRMVRILSRRTKNNPILIGEPGVGKTAVVEGLCGRIAENRVPKPVAGKRIFMLDMPSMVAGTKYRGEFEERIRAILREVQRAGDIIIFIDEIHTIVGAGSAEGAIDAANILKPAMSRGEIQIIGATTYEEYRRNIEKDSALERRFQPIKVEEPSTEDTFRILTGLRGKYEEYHKVKISDDALRSAIALSVRYINDRRLPDKALDLIDEAASGARLYISSPPPRMKQIEENIVQLDMMKEGAARAQDFESAAHFRDHEMKLRRELMAISEIWNNAVDGKNEIRAENIAEALSEQTGIPLSKITATENERLKNLEKVISKRVVGQEKAVRALCKAIRRSRTGLSDPKRPIGSFLFAGPTGVGKTEVCKALAEALFGDENMMIRIDMSEYMEKHELSKFTGSPPGYVGYDDAGGLCERVRKKPYSVVLFDETEKAHPDVFNILLQILEDGFLTDSHGRRADFRNCVIVMTSNIGARSIIKKSSVGFSSGDAEAEKIAAEKNIRSEIKRAFRPEFVNRIDEIIVFEKLSRGDISEICSLMLEKTVKRAEDAGIHVEITKEAREKLANLGFDEQYGARPLRRTIQHEIEDRLAEIILSEESAEKNYIVNCNRNGEIQVQYGAC